MKKLVSVLLVAVLLISVCILPVCAENTEKEFLFYDAFVEAFRDDQFYEDHNYYDELYYHYVDENDPDSEIDWAIVTALFLPAPMEEARIVADRYIRTTNISSPFLLRYGLYDVVSDEFIAIEKVDIAKYDGFEKGLEEAKVGNPFGDADFDGKLTILDATYIQQALAGLCEFNKEDKLDIGAWYEKYNRYCIYLSDIDCDGERTIFDATAIQMKLAKVEA